MTWQSLFDLSTMEHRHLLFAYAAVLVIQGGYLRVDRLELGPHERLTPLKKSTKPQKTEPHFVVREELQMTR